MEDTKMNGQENVRPNPMPGHPAGCKCWGCMGRNWYGNGCCGHRGFRIFRLIFIVIALFVAFSLGVKLGEIKSNAYGMEGFRDHGFYGDSGYPTMGGYYGGGMMPQLNQQAVPQYGAPSAVPQNQPK